jgi:putative ABC transport system permease protein
MISALDRKLLRDITRLKGQIATIAIVLAGGIICFIALRGDYLSLGEARTAYYDKYRFAHVFARLERAPESLLQRIETIPGVEVAETRIAKEVTLPIEGTERAAYGRILSLPASREPLTNALHLESGRSPERDDEMVLLESFAKAHGFRTGDRLPVVINGKERLLRVVGIALSPEFIYAIRPGAIVDDPKRYAVLWMERSALTSAFRLEGAFNDVSLRLAPGASEGEVREALDRLLEPYGGTGAIARKDQISNRIVTQELTQLQAISGMVPVIFLGVAAFLINMVLGRLIALQRPEIAALKAVGYTNREVASHYLGLVAVVFVPGAILGVAMGGWLGKLVLGVYARVFRLPDFEFHLSSGLVGSSLGASGAAAVLGALLAVRAAVKLPPAEAMRPPAPARFRKTLVERIGFSALVGATGLTVLRELERRPLRTLLSSGGIAGAVALLILSRFGWDSAQAFFEGTLGQEQRQDLTVSFARSIDPRSVGELGRLPGVARAEGMRTVPIRVAHEHRMRDSILVGLPAEATLRHLIEHGGKEVSVPADGVVLTKALADVLGLRVGDRPNIELRDGARRRVNPLIVGLVDEALGLQIYAKEALVQSLEQDLGAVSSVLLQVDREAVPEVESRLKRSPLVLDVSDFGADVRRMLDMNASIINVWTFVSVLLASAVIFGVVYNNARIALSARSRDLASLRVLGFSRAEVSRILLAGLAVEVLLAIPLGLYLGLLWARQFMSSVDQETYRWSVVVEPRTYLLASVVALSAGAASALWVRQSLDKLDLIGVLKTRE